MCGYETGGARGAYGEKRTHTAFGLGNVNERDNLEDLDVDGSA